MSDFLTINSDNAPIEQPSAKYVVDPRFWKPSIKNEFHQYQAIIRELPRGLDGIKNRLYPAVRVLVHRLKIPGTKIFKNIICPQTKDSKTYCPICEAGWAVYNKAKEENNKELMKKGLDMLPKATYYMNIYIVQDAMHPELNGQVKIWSHSEWMHNKLFEPTKKQDPNVPSLVAKKIYYPYSPKAGKNFNVIVVENPKNHIPSYDGSDWDSNGFSDLAPTDSEIEAILDQCYDLSEFEKVPTADEVGNEYSKFMNMVNQKTAAMTANKDFAHTPKSGSLNTYDKPSIPEPVQKNVSKGNAAEFFNLNSGTNETKMTPSASPNPQYPPTDSEDSADDDELPF